MLFENLERNLKRGFFTGVIMGMIFTGVTIALFTIFELDIKILPIVISFGGSFVGFLMMLVTGSLLTRFCNDPDGASQRASIGSFIGVVSALLIVTVLMLALSINSIPTLLSVMSGLVFVGSSIGTMIGAYTTPVPVAAAVPVPVAAAVPVPLVAAVPLLDFAAESPGNSPYSSVSVTPVSSAASSRRNSVNNKVDDVNLEEKNFTIVVNNPSFFTDTRNKKEGGNIVYIDSEEPSLSFPVGQLGQ